MTWGDYFIMFMMGVCVAGIVIGVFQLVGMSAE